MKSIPLLAALLLTGCASRRPAIEPVIEIPAPIQATQPAAAVSGPRFAVMGDIPYAQEEWATLDRQIADLNQAGGLSFVVHVGDIKTGGSDCEESIYRDVRAALERSEAPALILVGDNEWNDCDKGGSGPDPAAGWSYWQAHLAPLPDRWDTPDYSLQEGRPENRSWTQDGVLFISLLLPGGRIHDQAIWDGFLADGADWVRDRFMVHADATAVVIFGHANPQEVHAPVVAAIREGASASGVPVLYVHGDGHVWQDEPGWGGIPGLRRIQVTQGGAENPLQITVDVDDSTFVLERDIP